MHDPMVVAFEIPSPIPRRKDHRDALPGQKRWTFGRRRRTNAENLGEPVYRWWRPRGWEPKIAGRAWGFNALATIWHVEPNGADSGTVCKHHRRWQDDDGVWHAKHLRAWKWHVHHWHVQFHFGQRLGRFLRERCGRCKRRFPWGYAPISHSWEGGPAFHHECSALIRREHEVDEWKTVVRDLFAAFRESNDLSEAEAVDRLCGHSSPWPFHTGYRLQDLLGWERDDSYRLKRKAPSS